MNGQQVWWVASFPGSPLRARHAGEPENEAMWKVSFQILHHHFEYCFNEL